MSSPCAACTRACCRRYLVTVTGYDAWLIAGGMRLAPEQFLVTVPQVVQNGRGFFLDRSGTGYDIALEKRRVEGEDKPCIFWLELPGGIGRCGIYALRPFVCQTYPAFLASGGVIERRDDVLCPDDAWRDGVLQGPVWRERLLRMQVEFDIYGLAIARWNLHVSRTTTPGRVSPLAYYTYLMNYYAALDPIRRTVDATAWLSMCERWSAQLMDGASPLSDEGQAMGGGAWSGIVAAIRHRADAFFPDDPVPVDGAALVGA